MRRSLAGRRMFGTIMRFYSLLKRGGLLASSAKRRKVRLTIDAPNRRGTDTLKEYVQLLSADEKLACDLSVDADDSARSKQLQATDFVIGSIY